MHWTHNSELLEPPNEIVERACDPKILLLESEDLAVEHVVVGVCSIESVPTGDAIWVRRTKDSSNVLRLLSLLDRLTVVSRWIQRSVDSSRGIMGAHH
jgi:hypothetical protein